MTLKLDNGPTANQEHIISIITILSTNHFCFRRICQPIIPDYSEQSLLHEIDRPRQHEWGPGWKLGVYLISMAIKFGRSGGQFS
jgi:hypothetical protein